MKEFALLLLALAACPAHADIGTDQWQPSGDMRLYRIEVGNGVALRDTVVTVHGSGSGQEFGAASRTFDATPYRNSVLTLSARVTAHEVSGGAGIWLRATGDGRASAFANSQREPVRGDADGVERRVTIVVPGDATRISFGPLLRGSGRATVTG